MPRARTLTEVYRRFGEVDAVNSPLYQRVAIALSESDEAMRAIEAAPARTRQPARILAALHDLALAGRAPALAAAYADGAFDAAASAAIDTWLSMTDDVTAVAARRKPQTLATRHLAVLHPAIAEAARRAGADAVGLVDLGGSASLDLHVDLVGITYEHGPSVGDPASPVQLVSTIRGDRSVPDRPVPDVAARVRVERDPIDATDEDDARWLRACVWPDQPEQAATLDAAIALVRTAPPLLLPGDAEQLPDAIDRIPAGALPVVVTTWALSSVSPEGRQRFLDRLHGVAADRAVAWVSLEGVGVAPGVPTFGDRPASGHSIIGIAVFDGTERRVEAVGRCWSRGHWLSWLADP